MDCLTNLGLDNYLHGSVVVYDPEKYCPRLNEPRDLQLEQRMGGRVLHYLMSHRTQESQGEGWGYQDGQGYSAI